MAKYCFWFIAIVLFYVLINEITGILNIFYPKVEILLTVLFAAMIIALDLNKTYLSFGCYLAFIAVFLLFRRRPENNFNFEFYLWKWFKIIKSNRTVFINIFGNLLLFIPVLFYVKGRYNLAIAFGLIFLFEILQFITWRGVFDIVDIFLNASGVIIAKIIGLLNVFFRANNHERRAV